MESPSENAHADLIIESLECDVVVIAVTTLPSEDGNGLDGNVKPDECSGTPPNDWVSNEIDLSIVLAPEVDTPTEDRPRRRARIPSV